MDLLAIETSGPVGSVAVLRDEEVHERVLGERGRHGVDLPVAVRELLAETGLEPSGLDAVVVGQGPGSYTGTRIGVTFAKTLAFATGRPLVALTGLVALAADAPPAGALVAVLETGHRTRCYGAVYDRSTPFPREHRAPALWDPVALLDGLPPGTLVAGDAVPASLVPTFTTRGFVLVPAGPDHRVRAATLARLGARHRAAGLPPADPVSLEPLYLQPSAPERGPA